MACVLYALAICFGEQSGDSPIVYTIGVLDDSPPVSSSLSSSSLFKSTSEP